MSLHTFDVTAFRVQFPQFENVLAFPDAILQLYWDSATCYIYPCDTPYFSGDCLQYALNLMTAHLAAFSVLVANGQNPGFIQNATIDKISVAMQPPPGTRQYYWWLSSTPYGSTLLALEQAQSTGGFYIGGLPESSAIRKVGGTFLPFVPAVAIPPITCGPCGGG